MNGLEWIIIIGVSLSLSLIIITSVFKKILTKRVFLEGAKTSPNTSLVFIVRNNQQLLKSCLRKVKSLGKYITEIVVIDMGSIDNTLEVAKASQNNYTNIRIYNFDGTEPNNNYFDIIKNHVPNEQILIIDLNRIQTINPNVYIPDIFKSIEVSFTSKPGKYESRINGIRLLNFDFLEREKNSFILKEYIVEAFSNIHIQIELLMQREHESVDSLNKELAELKEYIDSTVKKTIPLLNLIGSTKYSGDSLVDNLTQVLKEYSQSTGISINYKILGKEKSLDKSLGTLLLSIVQDLLNFLLQSNSVSYMEIISKSNTDKFRLLLKYNSAEGMGNLDKEKSSLRYFILQSIQNRLNLVNGDLRVKLGKNNDIVIFIQFPTKVPYTKGRYN